MDTREYEWNDITLIIGGIDFKGFRGVKYNEKQEKEILYAKGNSGHSVQNGNKAIEGSLTLTQSALAALDAAGGGSLLDIRSITAVVMYGNPSLGVAPSSDTIKGLSFTERPKEWKQGDKFMESEVPFLALKVLPK